MEPPMHTDKKKSEQTSVATPLPPGGAGGGCHLQPFATTILPGQLRPPPTPSTTWEGGAWADPPPSRARHYNPTAGRPPALSIVVCSCQTLAPVSGSFSQIVNTNVDCRVRPARALCSMIRPPIV